MSLFNLVLPLLLVTINLFPLNSQISVQAKTTHLAQAHPITSTPTPTTTTVLATNTTDSNLNPQSLLNAINNYRIKNRVAPLIWDQKLANYAQTRAGFYQQSGNMDHHTGFSQLTSQSTGFYQLGFRKLGENSSSGFSGNPIELVEKLYAESVKHQENQLSSGWSHIGTGVSGEFTNIVFGGAKI